MNNELTHQRIVVRWHTIALVDVRVPTYSWAAWDVQTGDEAWAWDKGLWIFGVDTALKGVAVELDVLLLDREWVTGANGDHLTD